MESDTHLGKFLRGCVAKQKRERYAALVNSKKGRKKFLSALDHDLERDIDQTKVIRRIPESEWPKSCTFYSSQGSFGILVASIQQAYENAPWYGGWLIVSASGMCGVYRPEGRIDNESYIKL